MTNTQYLEDDELRNKVEEAMITILQKDQFIRKGAYIAQSETVDRVMQLIKARDEQREREIKRKVAQELQTKIVKYGDGVTAYHNGEAYVLISDVLALTQSPKKKGSE